MLETLRTLTEEERALADQAGVAAANAYVPYSGFPVGAAIRLRTGDVVLGCNVENAAYGLTNCAERTAIFRLIAEGRDPAAIDAIAVSVDGPEGQPCGSCRQVLAEFAPDATIAFRTGDEWRACTVRDLLPSAFLPGALDA